MIELTSNLWVYLLINAGPELGEEEWPFHKIRVPIWKGIVF